jgi:amidohydrolase
MQNQLLIPEYILAKCKANRRQIHQNPEIGFEVQQTAALVQQELEALGLTVYSKIGRTGLYADLIVPNATKHIGFRADMDALEIQEENEVSYRSKIPGRGHLCGHDAHTAMLLAAATYLVAHKADLKQSIRFIFQPNEENIPGGAVEMIADGVLDGLDAIFGLHAWPSIPTGQTGICTGPAMGLPDSIYIEIIGKGGHAAFPQHCIDPVVIAAQYISSAQSIVSRSISPLDAAVVSFTMVNAGSAYNIIPERIQLTASVRSLSTTVQAELKRRLEAHLSHICALHQADYSYDYIYGHPITFNAPEAAAWVAESLKKQYASSAILEQYPPVMAGEDFGHYAKHIPACFSFLGCRNEAKGLVNELHHPKFNIDETCLAHGIRHWVTLATTALKL